MKIMSPAFKEGEEIPRKYSCDGNDINPTLSIINVPEKAKSLALIMDDPDAPMNTWTHWTLWNIKPNTREIGENSVPQGAREGETDFGKPGYGGPCPPFGTHRYYFRVYALKERLKLPQGAKVHDLMKEMKGKIIEKTEFMGKYTR